jgi:S-layer homology domain
LTLATEEPERVWNEFGTVSGEIPTVGCKAQVRDHRDSRERKGRPMDVEFGGSRVPAVVGTESTTRNVTPRDSASRRVVLVLVCMFAAGVMTADGSPVPRASGSSPEIILQLPALGFYGTSDTQTTDACPWPYYVAGKGALGSTLFMPVTLPNGAQVTGIVLYYCDKDPTHSSTGLAILKELTGTSDPKVFDKGAAESGNDGFGAAGSVLDPPLTISNSNQYYVEVYLADGVGFKAVDLRYHIQMGPPPAKATFADVPPDYLYFRAIEALAGSGITSGCGSGNFCPDKTVTRGELAKFLAVALGLNWPE